MDIDIPVFFWYKVFYLVFSVADYLQGGRLYSACAQSSSYLSPQERAYLISHQPVKDSPCLLGIYQLQVYGPWVLYGGLDGIFCYLVEYYPAVR